MLIKRLLLFFSTAVFSLKLPSVIQSAPLNARVTEKNRASQTKVCFLEAIDSDDVESKELTEGRVRLNFGYRLSDKYIQDADFREQLSSKCPEAVVRLNLGSDFRVYVENLDFKERVDSLVKDPETQVWSDIQSIGLVDSKQKDISPMARLTSLTQLTLMDTQVEDISVVRTLKNLQSFILVNTQVTDIGALRGLTNLKHLTLKNNPFGNISALQGLRNLESLYVENMPVKDLTPLQGLRNLKNVHLENTLVHDISPVADLPNLILRRIPDADFDF